MNNKNNKFRQAVFVVIYRKNNLTKNFDFLLLKRKKHWIGWEFTKGGVESSDKNLFATAKREVYEESSLKPIKIKKFNVQGKYLYKRRLQDRAEYIGQTYSLFSAQVAHKKGKIKIDKSEHSSFKWLSFEKAYKKLRFSNQKRCLAIVNKSLKNDKN